MTATIFHNPKCSTSRNALAALREAGGEPQVVLYLETGWTRPQLQGLLRQTGLSPRDLLRAKEPLAKDLRLTDPGVSDDALLDAFVAHPILVERPIVVTDKGAALCRPVEKVQALI